MKLKPVKEKTVFFNNSDETLETLIQCCDSYVAVLTPDQVGEWFGIFEKIVSAVL
jgi:hypothetical protein